MLLFCNTFCFYMMPPIIISPFHLKENSTDAQKDGGDINFSFEPKEKAHASTKLPFSFEGRTIFHLEPKQNFKGVQRQCPLSELLLKAGINLAGSEGCTRAFHRRAVRRAGRVLWLAWGWGPSGLLSPSFWLPGALSDTAPSFLVFPMLKWSSDSSLVLTSLNCLLGSS